MGYMDSELPGLSPQSTLNLGVTGSAQGAASGFNPMTALGGLGIEAASAWYSNRKAQARQRESFDQQKWMMQNRYQMQTKDLMAAGLNPMLAVSQGAPMPNAPGQAQVSKPDLLNAMANATISSAQAEKLKQETINLKGDLLLKTQEFALLGRQYDRIGSEIRDLEQKVASGKASEEDTKQLKKLHEAQEQSERQGIKMKRPEEIASGTEAAVWAAHISRALKPLVDMAERYFPKK